MKRVLLLIFITLSVQIIYSQWTEIKYHPTKNDLYDLASPDGETVFMTGSNGTIIKVNSLTNSFAEISVNIDEIIGDIIFSSDGHGFFISQYGDLYRSNDEGNTWQLINNNKLLGNPASFIMCDSAVGYWDGYGIDSLFIRKTIDGGLSWEKINIINYMRSFHFHNRDTAWIAQDSLQKTIDGLQTLYNVPINGQTSVAAIGVYFIDTLNGWVSSYNDTLYRTYDGGATWNSWYIDEKISNLHFVDEFNGTAQTSAGLKIITKDGGLTWSKFSTPFGSQCYKRIGNRFWSCGPHGTISYSDSLPVWQPVGTNFYISQYEDILILNDSTHGIVHRHGLWITNNRGENYREINMPFISGGQYYLYNSGWMENNQKYWLGTSFGKIVTTSDGGSNWTVSYDNQLNDGDIQDVQFIDSLRGWAILNHTEYSVLKTVDGGQTWASSIIQTNEPLKRMTFTDYMHGWVGDISGNVHYTTNGGNTWTTVPDVINSFYDIQFVNNQLGYAYGNHTYKTTDGGITWEEFYTDRVVISGHFINENQGWLLCPNEVLFTEDGGENWNYQESPGYPDYLNSFMDFYDHKHGIILTYDPYNLEHTIFQTHNGGSTWVEQVKIEKTLAVSCYPNPFVYNTEVVFNLSKPELITIEVYNSMGELMDIVESKMKCLRGENRIKLNGCTWNPGIYFCRVSSENYSETTKIVKVE